MTTKDPLSSSTYPPTQYILPNDCTLSKTVSLFSWENVQSFKYQLFVAIYQALSNETILTFAFRQDSSYWCVDDVSFFDIVSKTELIINGDFEYHPVKGFFYCISNGSQSMHTFPISSDSHSGRRAYCGGSVNQPDYLSYKIPTKIGYFYRISFWLENNDDAPNAAKVLISY